MSNESEKIKKKQFDVTCDFNSPLYGYSITLRGIGSRLLIYVRKQIGLDV